MPAEKFYLHTVVAYCPDCEWSSDELDDEEHVDRLITDHNALRHGMSDGL